MNRSSGKSGASVLLFVCFVFFAFVCLKYYLELQDPDMVELVKQGNGPGLSFMRGAGEQSAGLSLLVCCSTVKSLVVV